MNLYLETLLVVILLILTAIIFFFSIDGRYGSYNNGFNEGDLSEKEMRKALENREFLILANYYGKFYPGLLETLQNARTHTKEIKYKI